MMRIACFLLVAVLLSTSVISGTFAKYITSADSNDSARVARWGFEENEINIEDLFVAAYDGSVNGVDEDVIAPGTKGSATIAFVPAKGIPEVAYSIAVTAETNVDTATNTICTNPKITWALYAEDTAEEDIVWGNFDALMTKIETDLSQVRVEANTAPKLNGNYVIAWKWDFNNVDDVDDTQNVLDTEMGNAEHLETIDLTISITATQLD